MTVRMAVTNTVVSAAVVGIFGYFNAVGTEEAFRESAQREETERRTELRRRGESECRRVAVQSMFALSNNDYGFLTNVLGPVVEADPGLTYAFIVDPEGQLVAKSERQGSGLTQRRIEANREDPAGPAEAREVPYGATRVLEVGVPIQSNQRVFGRVVLGYSLRQLRESQTKLDRMRDTEIDRIWNITMVLALVLLVASSVMAVFQSIRVGRPIVSLTRAAERIANGELGTQVNLRAGAELGVLADRFDHMSRELAELVNEVAAKAAMEKELEVARSVQDAIIPEAVIHEVGGLNICGHYVPASRCGGDWWAYFPLDAHRTLIVIGDVTGHGVPATLIAASARACCEVVYTTNVELGQLVETHTATADYLCHCRSISHLLERLNQTVLSVGRGRFCMTCFAAVIDTRLGTLTHANAGHDPPLLLRTNSRGRVEVDALHAGASRRLGEHRDITFDETTQPMEAGSTVVLYTDGIVEIANADQRPYGERRLVRSLKKRLALPADQLGSEAMDDAIKYGDHAPAADDITVVVIQWPASASSKEIINAA